VTEEAEIEITEGVVQTETNIEEEVTAAVEAEATIATANRNKEEERAHQVQTADDLFRIISLMDLTRLNLKYLKQFYIVF
jgi:hypothetical protein